jgi:hypothetical protein
MTLPWFATKSVAVKTYPTISDHGAHVFDFTAEPTRRTISNCSWQPSDGDEQDDRREATMRTGRLYMPPTANVDGASIIEIDGKDYSVVGDPADWSTQPMWPHVVAVVQRWEG